MNDGYSLREVGKLLGLSRSIITGLIEAGFVRPGRGPRGEFRFTFRDLVLLRAAQGLSEARLSSARILRSLRRLRAQLPEEMPLTGLRIEALGDAVVVSEGASAWQAADGQYVLRFALEAPDGRVAFFEGQKPQRAAPDPRWFEQGVALEASDAEGACAAYRRALREDERHLCAYINLGRCLHSQGKLQEAESVYREGLEKCGADEVLLFNLAVLMEDLERHEDAANAYRAALERAPDMADAHYNLALLCEAKGLRQEALRHLSAYRKLNT